MIETVSFKNFKALRKVELPLQRLTVLVGPNASGKTSVLQGLWFMSQLREMDPAEVFSGDNDPQHLISSGASEPMMLTVRGRAQQWTLSAQVTPLNKKKARPEHRFCVDREYGGVTDQYDSTAGSAFQSWSKSKTRALDEAFPEAVLLQLNAKALAKPIWPEVDPKIQADGAGLADVLENMKSSDDPRFQSVLSALKKIVPTVLGIRFERTKLKHLKAETIVSDGNRKMRHVEHETTGYRLMFEVAGGKVVPAHGISEGTLLMLGLLTVLSEPGHPRLILIDDLEHGLHPKAHGPLIDQLRKLLEEDDQLQIVATSHSPYMLDQLRYEEVRLVTLLDDGSTACASPAEHPDYAKWKDNMDPGEFWSMIDENWIKNRA